MPSAKRLHEDTAVVVVTDNCNSSTECWKCRGKGRKYQKSSQQFDGNSCGVCKGTGQRQASDKSRQLAEQPGRVIELRGYPPGQANVGGFLGPPAVGSNNDKNESKNNMKDLVGPGELLASLGCGDWRIYQLANGHKLTVDDFICAWVAAEEMRKRSYGPPQPSTNTSSSSHFGRAPKTTDDDTTKTLRHADIGCGCGSVLMTLAWAFPGSIQSHGVEAQELSFGLCRRGLLWNLGTDGSLPEHPVRVSHQDLRFWDGGDGKTFDLITGTPPYFPQDRFVASENHAQKIRCRVPTRGAACDYIEAAARLLAPNGVFCIVETARKEGEIAVLEAVQKCQLQVQRRLDVVTRTGLPPRFSCWVIIRRKENESGKDSQAKDTPIPEEFDISTLSLRNNDNDQTRTLEYIDAMEKMGWIDFENTRAKLAERTKG